MLFHSGRINTEAATYQIVGVGDSTQTYGYSNLFLFVPITWFTVNAQDPIALYLRWSQMLAYGPVARLLKPLRTTKPWGCWGCDKDESLNWLARFDGVADRMSVTRVH